MCNTHSLLCGYVGLDVLVLHNKSGLDFIQKYMHTHIYTHTKAWSSDSIGHKLDFYMGKVNNVNSTKQRKFFWGHQRLSASVADGHAGTGAQNLVYWQVKSQRK